MFDDLHGRVGDFLGYAGGIVSGQENAIPAAVPLPVEVAAPVPPEFSKRKIRDYFKLNFPKRFQVKECFKS